MAKKTDTANRKKAKRSPPYVNYMTIIVERAGNTSKHRLYFHKHELTLTEMYEDGFLGDLELPAPDGTLELAELDATPAEGSEKERLGHFVFSIVDPKTKEPVGAVVKKFSFSKSE